jgi:hypothetical protein
MKTTGNLTELLLLDRSTLAASVMGQRRAEMAKVRRPISGVIDGKRRRKFSLLVLPNGQIGELLGCLRGQVFFRWSDLSRIDPVQIGTAPESQVSYYPLPAARALGRLRKGVRERPSARKAASSRRNGARPVRPGSRPRGRPAGARRPLPTSPPDAPKPRSDPYSGSATSRTPGGNCASLA